ncbi:trans-aconitate 2-methyltransferase [Streptomyces sp. NPDC004684]
MSESRSPSRSESSRSESGRAGSSRSESSRSGGGQPGAGAPAPVWDPAQYLRHAGHRARPFADLLARVPPPPTDAPRIADLGCGPGNVTALLADRWPAAHITGYDNSPEMLDKAVVEHAGPTPGGGRLDFAHADVRTWTPPEQYDLIVSNATLQWVPGHAGRFADWVAALKPGGALAFQVPGNFAAPSHTIMRALAGSARWRDRLDGVLRHDDAVLGPGEYLERLTALGCAADVWETTYVHLLQGEDPVLDWVKGTGLRPVLTVLADDPGARDAFLAEYRTALREAYPAGPHGTPFPFRRIFAVARKEA